MNARKTLSMIILGLGCASWGSAQEGPERRDRRTGPPHPGVTVDWSTLEQRIAWFGTMESAQAAAKKTARPILLVSGAPACQAVPGVW